jgi:hypothetical protein
MNVCNAAGLLTELPTAARQAVTTFQVGLTTGRVQKLLHACQRQPEDTSGTAYKPEQTAVQRLPDSLVAPWCIADLYCFNVFARCPQNVCCTLLMSHKGYAVEVVDGLILAAFAHPADVSGGVARATCRGQFSNRSI